MVDTILSLAALLPKFAFSFAFKNGNFLEASYRYLLLRGVVDILSFLNFLAASIDDASICVANSSPTLGKTLTFQVLQNRFFQNSSKAPCSLISYENVFLKMV